MAVMTTPFRKAQKADGAQSWFIRVLGLQGLFLLGFYALALLGRGIRFGSGRILSRRLGSYRLASSHLASTHVVSVPFGSRRLVFIPSPYEGGSLRITSSRLNSLRVESLRVRSIRLPSGRLASLGLIWFSFLVLTKRASLRVMSFPLLSDLVSSARIHSSPLLMDSRRVVSLRLMSALVGSPQLTLCILH